MVKHVGIAGERGLYDLLVPVRQAEVKVDKGIVREFEGLLGGPDEEEPGRKLQEVYGGMTAKASQDTFTYAPSMAVSSISTLIERYNTESTTMLAIKILNKTGLIDLSMRMFDKDQVGGDREISILTSEFRVLQYISECFFESLDLIWHRAFSI